MSDSDDTDVLLLIPPDLFIVPSSDSDESEYRCRKGISGSGVVSEILEHVQSLETRISAIESKDNSLDVSLLNASLDSQAQPPSHPAAAAFLLGRSRQARYSLSQLSSLPNTPAKPLHTSSVVSSPGCHWLSPCVTNTTRSNETMRLGRHAPSSDVANPINASAKMWRKHDEPPREHNATATAFRASDGTARDIPLCGSLNSAGSNSAARHVGAACKSTSVRREDGRDVREMELSEVDELLQEMEATEIELAKRIDSSNSHRYSKGFSRNVSRDSGKALPPAKAAGKQQSPMRRLDFQFVDEESHGPFDGMDFHLGKNSEKFADVSLPDEDAGHLDETDKIISGFKTWEPSGQRNLNNSSSSSRLSKNFTKMEEITSRNVEKLGVVDEDNNRWRASCSGPRKHPETRSSPSSATSDVESHIPTTESTNCRSLPNIQHSVVAHSVLNDCDKSRNHFGQANNKTEDTVDSGLQGTRHSQCTMDLQQTVREIQTMGQRGSDGSVARHTENTGMRKTHRLHTLSDFWDSDGTKSQEEMLRIKLEEEKFRREHCEHVIQELQKRLLEQQEKVAVAIRVDNEKNAAISQFQNAWSNLKQRWERLEKDHSELEVTLRNVKEKHASEMTEYQQQIKRGEGELSKALDLAAGYKEKSDNLVKEKLELLKSHADELEKYKSLVQEAEQRYENLKMDYNKLLEKSKQLEELSNNAQQELNRERLRSSEVRTEMGVIHKALDACEAELTILRQEKENLNLMIKEEGARNGILEQNKAALLQAITQAKNAEKAAKDDAKALIDRQEQIRSELREVYQNQVDDVVKTKLKEFQQQLDAAETAFQVDLENRQRAIAECAARKIKSVIDKHQLEINLLEEKHMEEKRLGEIQLAQASQKAAMLESQLSMQRATKTQLAEQLHSIMQKQWQQALQIISGGNMENLSPLQRLTAERFFEVKKPKRCHSACCNKDSHSMKPELRSSSSQNLQRFDSRQEQDESLVTLTSNDETPVTTRKESNDDLRKYIKMILDMQQPKDDFIRPKHTEQSSASPPPVIRKVPRKHYTKKEPDSLKEESVTWQQVDEILDMQQPKDDFIRTKHTEQSSASPPPVIRVVPRKHYTKKEPNSLKEESVTWQQVDEQSVYDTSEYIPMPQPQGHKSDQQRFKPPWK